MSNLTPDRQATPCYQDAETHPIRSIEGRQASLGAGLTIRRLLPTRGKRLVGAWCFLDHFGPVEAAGSGMDVGPHPHIGLQTVTWLFSGELLHKDSLGYEQRIVPGQLNLMTAGRGISHSEESPAGAGGGLHGVQLWLALPEAQRHCAAAFAHHADLPRVHLAGLELTVFIGRYRELVSPAVVHSPLLGMEIALRRPGCYALALEPGFEHALIVTGEAVRADGHELGPGALHDLGRDRERLELEADAPTTLVLVGGAPFEESILMWWNFVARSREEIERARDDWEAGRHFEPVPAYRGERLPAPELKTGLR